MKSMHFVLIIERRFGSISKEERSVQPRLGSFGVHRTRG
jgi:hypothetical protein